MNPVFGVNNIEQDMAYYKDILGFEIAWTWGDPIVRSGVKRDGYEIQLDASEGGPTGKSVIYFHISNIETYHDICQKNGANLELALGERCFGMRDFRVLDLSGNQLGFGESKA